MAGSKMHDDEVETDAGLVARLLAAQFPKWAKLPIEAVPSAGTDNALYRLGSNMAVRMPRIDWAVNAVDREHQPLAIVAMKWESPAKAASPRLICVAECAVISRRSAGWCSL